MTTLRHPCSHSTATWLLLMIATLISWSIGEKGESGLAWAGVLSLITVIKGSAIILDFMGLAKAPALWRGLVLGWLIFVLLLIGLIYWNGVSQ